ncbi:MAG: GNAT family N-acetyltransferase [Oscillospiraceae bacterium]
MEHRLAVLSDLDEIMHIINSAQAFLASSQVDQWQDGYPARQDFENDIRLSACHVFLQDNSIAGVITIALAREPDYATIYDGAWLTENTPYAVVHRSAVGENYRNKTIAYQMMSYAETFAAENGFHSLRIDTHKMNLPMRGLLEKLQYSHCGTIYIDGRVSEKTARVCYEKLITN